MRKPKLSVIRNRKGVVIALRFVLLLVLIMIVVCESRAAVLHWLAYFMIAILGLSNLALLFLPAPRFETQKNSGWIFFSDAIIVTVLVSTISHSPSGFLVAYFLSILIAASSSNTLAAFLATFVVTLIYGALTMYGKTDVVFLSTAFLGRIILFFVTATFAGYLSEERFETGWGGPRFLEGGQTSIPTCGEHTPNQTNDKIVLHALSAGKNDDVGITAV